MKILELIKKSFATVGIRPYQANEKSAFNVTNTFFVFAIGIGLSSSSAYVLIEASDFEEYINSCFLVSAQAISIVFFISIVLNTLKLYAFFDYLGDTIQKSEYIRILPEQKNIQNIQKR